MEREGGFVRMTNPQNVTLDFHGGTLRLHGVSESFVRKCLSTIPLLFDDRENCFRCDANHRGPLEEALKKSLASKIDSQLNPRTTLSIPDHRTLSLREDQQNAVNVFLNSGHIGLISMPTGTGKTVVAIELLIRLARSTLVVVPVRDLIYQWHSKILEATGIDAGIIGDGVHRVSPISVATYDSATIHMPRIGDRFEFLVFDEVHHLPAKWFQDAARMSTAQARLGLTATLPTDSSRLRTLNELIGPTVYEQTIADAKGKTLADYDVRRIPIPMDLSEQRSYEKYSAIIQNFVADRRRDDPAFQWKDTQKLIAATKTDPELAESAREAMAAFRAKRKIEDQAEGKLRVLEDLFRIHRDEAMLVFAGSNVMARKVSLRFLVPCLLSHCGKRERREWLEGFAEGKYRVLVANRVLDEGVDLPEVKVAVILGGTSSSRQAIQRLGRVLRRHGKNRAILYELVADQTREVQRSRDRRRNEAFRGRKS